MTEMEVIEAEEIGTEIEIRGTHSLVPAHDPAEFVEKASVIAKSLADVIEQRKLYAIIGKKKHLLYEAWTFLGSMMGAFGQSIFAIEDWTKEYRDPDSGAVIGWEARVVAKAADGREVGAAESMCTRKEARWAKADDYAIRSMAQTRAASKALRQPLGFIVQLAGYEPTPFDEMPVRDSSGLEPDTQTKPQPPDAVIKGPEPLRQPTSWAKVTEMVSAYDEKTYETFMAFASACRRLLYPGATDTKSLAKEEKAELLRVAGGAALALRNAVDAGSFPPPTVEDIRAAWAKVLEGQELAIPEDAAE